MYGKMDNNKKDRKLTLNKCRKTPPQNWHIIVKTPMPTLYACSNLFDFGPMFKF